MSNTHTHFANSYSAQNDQQTSNPTQRFSSTERTNPNQSQTSHNKTFSDIRLKRQNPQTYEIHSNTATYNTDRISEFPREITIQIEQIQDNTKISNLRSSSPTSLKRRENIEVDLRKIYAGDQQNISGDFNQIGIQRDLEIGQSRNINGEEFVPRSERVKSFSDTISSSKSSSRGINSSISLEDDGSSSDAGASSHDDDFERLRRIHVDENDLESKIKWFFQRIEQDEQANLLTKNRDLKEDLPPNESLHQNSSQEACLNTSLGDTDMPSTHEDSNSSSDEHNSILGKRKGDHIAEPHTTKRSKISESKEQNIVGSQEDAENSDYNTTNQDINCFFPQFQAEFNQESMKKRDSKCCRDKKTSIYATLTPELPKFNPLVSGIPQYSTPQMSQPKQHTSVEKSSPTIKQTKVQVFEKAKILAKKYKGECLSTSYSICKGKNALKFRCQNNHTFFVAADIIEQIQLSQEVSATLESKSVKAAASSPKIISSISDDWCYKCRKFYNTCKEVAAQNGIVIVEGLYSTKINLKCEKKHHQFKISYTKKLNTLSCSDCRKEEREEWKELLRQQEQRRNEEYQRKQQELFEQARQEMESDKPQGYYGNQQGHWQGSQSSQSSSSRKSFNYYAVLEEQVNLQAQKLTGDYLKKNKDNNNCNNQQDSEKVFIVYKFIQTPIEALIAGMMQMQRDQAIQYFRRLAKLLHPDKNQHPLAKEAFQKLSEAVQAVNGHSGKARC